MNQEEANQNIYDDLLSVSHNNPYDAYDRIRSS